MPTLPPSQQILEPPLVRSLCTYAGGLTDSLPMLCIGLTRETIVQNGVQRHTPVVIFLTLGLLSLIRKAYTQLA